MNLETLNINSLCKKIAQDKNWTLFIDRDGVINNRIIGDYVKSANEFKFLDGVLEAIPIFNKFFQKIIIVTNQQGIGKGLMTEEDLKKVHDYLIENVEKNGGKIHKIYFCPELAKNNPECRKPNIGMALKAKKDFPEIDFSKSIMIGDSISDMKFAKNSGMISIAVGNELFKLENELIDYKFKNMLKFASLFN
jgi:D-glycero-D-manno-heptose 1,7-bisphosphate phosphatase